MSGRRRGGFDESILVFLQLNTMFEMKLLTLKAVLFWICWITIKPAHMSFHQGCPLVHSLLRRLVVTFPRSLCPCWEILAYFRQNGWVTHVHTANKMLYFSFLQQNKMFRKNISSSHCSLSLAAAATYSLPSSVQHIKCVLSTYTKPMCQNICFDFLSQKSQGMWL